MGGAALVPASSTDCSVEIKAYIRNHACSSVAFFVLRSRNLFKCQFTPRLTQHSDLSARLKV